MKTPLPEETAAEAASEASLTQSAMFPRHVSLSVVVVVVVVVSIVGVVVVVLVAVVVIVAVVVAVSNPYAF